MLQCADKFAPAIQTARVKMNVSEEVSEQQYQKWFVEAGQIVPQMG